MKRFDEQKVVISGASRGIGKAISLAFLEEGATVIGIYASNKESADLFKDECSTFGDKLELHQCDVSDPLQVENLYKDIESRHDTIDILINNAGIRKDKLLALMDHESWQKVVDINLGGTFNMCRHGVLLMLKQKYGRIINITSPVASMGFAGQTNYGASKAGQIGLTRSLCKETARKKITVNCVSPGFIDTELIEDLTESQLKEYKKSVPMRRFGSVDEVASAVLFLASKEASYISGAVLEVNGGL